MPPASAGPRVANSRVSGALRALPSATWCCSCWSGTSWADRQRGTSPHLAVKRQVDPLLGLISLVWLRSLFESPSIANCYLGYHLFYCCSNIRFEARTARVVEVLPHCMRRADALLCSCPGLNNGAPCKHLLAMGLCKALLGLKIMQRSCTSWSRVAELVACPVESTLPKRSKECVGKRH